MAVCGVFNANEYQYVIQKESTLGTPVLTDGGSETGLALDVIGIPDIVPGAFRSQNAHNSVGRTAKIGDMKTQPKLNENNISFTMYLDESNSKFLLENCLSNPVGSSPASFDLPYDFSNTVCLGDTDTDWTGAFTFARVSPVTSETDIYPGCVVDVKSIYVDGEDESGRWKADVTLKSRIVPALNSDSSGWTITPYATDEARYLTDLSSATSVKTIEGIEFVMSSFRIDLTSGVKFFGFDNDGDMEEIGRGLSEFMVDIDVQMKMDSGTKAFKEYMITQDTLDLKIYNDAWATSTFGFRADYCTVRDGFNIEEVKDGVFFTLPLKATASTSGDVVQIVL